MAGYRFPNESDDYRARRAELLEMEKELRTQVDAVAKMRRELPLGGRLEEDYRFESIDGDGNVIDASSGRQFVSEEHRLFFFGESWPDDNPAQGIDMSPVEFIYPGEPGFFADTPLYECNVIESGYQP